MKPLDIVDSNGNARERGFLYGKSRRSQIEACLADWLASLRGAGIGDPRAYLSDLVRETDFLPAIRTHCHDLLEEVQGMAAGAGQPFELLYAAQLMDEEWAYRGTAAAQHAVAQKCSSLAVSQAEAGVILGQNMDLSGYTAGHQVVQRIAPHDSVPGVLLFSISSMIGLLGVNSQRLGVCVNSLPQLPTAHHGLPVAFVMRKLLQARTLEEACLLVNTLPHATGQHYLLASPHGIRSFEAAPERVVELRPEYPNRVFHTNHPLAPWPEPFGYNANSTARLQCLIRRLSMGSVDIEAAQAALSSRDDPEHPVSCTIPEGAPARVLAGMTNFTTGSMITSLRDDERPIDVWISAGPPSVQGYAQAFLI